MILVSQINGDFELDLTNCKSFFTHENNWFTKNKVTGYSLPEELPYDIHEFFIKYQSDNAEEYEVKFDVIYNEEGTLYKAKFTIVQLLDHTFTFSISYGYDEFPNSEKKLSELELDIVEVTDIRTHATWINSLFYPSALYYFPLIHTSQYSKEELNYEAFKGSYNLKGNDGIFLTNSIDTETNKVFNNTIMKPYLYWLGVLKLIIEQAGFQLEGDILNDDHFKKMLVINTAKFEQQDRPETTEIIVGFADFSRTGHNSAPKGYGYYGLWIYDQEILLTGKFRIKGRVRESGLKYIRNYVRIYLDGVKIFEAAQRTSFNIDLVVNIPAGGGVVRFEKFDYEEIENVMELELIPIDLYDENGTIINYVIDPKVIDLKKSLPDVTQGEFIDTTMSWGNYDFTVEGKKVIMNKIEKILKRKRNAADWRKFEAYSKERNTDSGNSYLLKFKDSGSDEVKLVQAFISYDGILTDNFKTTSSTTEIVINTIPLPLQVNNNQLSAAIYKDDEATIFAALRSDSTTDNRTLDPVLFLIPSVVETSYKRYLRFLINTIQYQWSFNCSTIELKDFNIKQEIYAYDNNHFIKKITRDKINGIEDVTVETYLIR